MLFLSRNKINWLYCIKKWYFCCRIPFLYKAPKNKKHSSINSAVSAYYCQKNINWCLKEEITAAIKNCSSLSNTRSKMTIQFCLVVLYLCVNFCYWIPFLYKDPKTKLHSSSSTVRPVYYHQYSYQSILYTKIQVNLVILCFILSN